MNTTQDKAETGELVARENEVPSRYDRNPYAKDHVPCRFCKKTVAIRLKIGRSAYKPQHYPHRCEHGNICLSSTRNNSNWAAVILGGKVALGCADCLREQQVQYNLDHGREIFKV